MTQIEGYKPSAEERASVPEIQADDLTLIYHCDYYDGPLTGMLEWKGSWYWFQCFNQAGPEEKWCRYFGLWQLSPESNEWESERHFKFLELVGDHCEHRESSSGTFNPVSHPTWMQYYDLYPPDKRMLLTGQLVGWSKW